MSRAAVTILGASTASQVRENAGSLAFVLSQGEMQLLDRISAVVKYSAFLFRNFSPDIS